MRITFEDISLLIDRRPFFSNLTWRIGPGQHWAVVGPTGAGKSLLARAILHRLPITHGQILYAFDTQSPERPFLHPGEILVFSAETHRAFLNRFATYYQARWQSLEGEDNPTVGRYLSATRKLPKLEPTPNPIQPVESSAINLITPQDLFRISTLLDLEPLLGRQVHHLSNGESRKVFLAHLFLASPRLLILDDPYAGLDAPGRESLALAVETLLAQGNLQVLICASRGEDIPTGVSHVLVLENGRVLALGPRDDASVCAALAHLFPDPSQSHPTAAAINPSASYPTPALSAAVSHYADDLKRRAGLYPPVLVEMRGVTVTYDAVRVLDNITWRVRQGERWLLSGPNGAGKSSLLSLLLADNPQAYANPVYLFGRRHGSGASIWETKRATGWVSPELQAFYATRSIDRPSYSCQQVVVSGFFDSIGLYHHPTPSQARTAAGWIEALGLTPMAERLFSTLSNGQQRQALLARALVKHPPLLVLDEPCQALDPENRQRFTTLVDSLCAVAPLTLIYVTHDPAEILACITHHLRLEHGHAG